MRPFHAIWPAPQALPACPGEAGQPLLEALVAAQGCREEVMAVIESSEDSAEAGRALVSLLGLAEEGHAMVVLDMQMSRWTRQQRQRITDERDELRATLAAPAGGTTDLG